MSASTAGSIVKVSGNVPSLFLAAGDFLLLKPDGTPLCIFRQLDAFAAGEIAERFGLGVVMDATTGPAGE